ncbi:MAG TPA: D-alanine--D-alanine ligase family protein [Nocardioidaceae bacterium]|nr:D-alanine--D-alanine ligase family protein [Nocardioidaceae bacterium]
MRTRVVVIGGGQNCEHQVSLGSAAAVRAALSSYDVLPLTIGRDGTWLGANGRPLADTRAASLARAIAIMASYDVVVPMVHGPLGEDGTLASLCELAGVAYVGSGVRGGALAMDKWATKLVAQELGIRTAAGRLVRTADLVYSGPVVVKPVAAGSSHGVSLVRSEAELAPALEVALALDDRVLVEEVLDGREVDVAVLRRANGSLLVGPTLEIVSDGFFDTERKYDGSATFLIPAPLTGVQTKELEDAALSLFEALGCDGVARFDFFVTEGGVVLNEVNTMPGMTEQSQVPKMFAAIGLPYDALLRELVEGAR